MIVVEVSLIFCHINCYSSVVVAVKMWSIYKHNLKKNKTIICAILTSTLKIFLMAKLIIVCQNYWKTK